ncbi:MAG: type II secretion system protein GspG [Sandaracinaceae bacterium]|jgi:type II secretory pathway pseudopilin PulG|nr:type II secretion system protein GspG [Sandaracinaceae bacterium]
MARRAKSQSSISLPWERRSAWFSGLFAQGRWRVMLLIGFLLFVVYSVWSISDRNARTRATRSAIAEVQRAIARFRTDLGRCPHSTVELVHPPRTGVRYLTELPTDGWGKALWIQCPGHWDAEEVDVVSAGPSGSFVDDDNIQ